MIETASPVAILKEAARLNLEDPLREGSLLRFPDYGQLVMTHIQSLHKEYGIEIVATEKFEVGATDVSTQAAKVRAASPDVVGVIATSPVPFRNARQMRITQPIVSAVGSSSYEYVKGMGDFADDIVFAEFIVSEDPLPHQKEFVELFQKEKGTLPKTYDAAGWDAVHVLAQAVEKAGPDAGYEALAAAIRSSRYRGVVAQYDFGAPDMTGIEWSPAQKAQRQRLARAMAYAM